MEEERRCSCNGWIDPRTGICEDCGTRHPVEGGFDDWLPWVAGLAAALLLFGIGLVALRAARTATRRPAPAASAPAQPNQPRPDSTAAVVQRVLPSVVAIQTNRSTGSGFVYSRAGYVLTNAHVIETSNQIEVVSNDGTVFAAQLAGMDRKTDLAMLKVPNFPAPPLPLGDSESLLQGDEVLAVGSPLGLENSVSTGIVSAFRNNVEIGGTVYQRLIQTTAPIAHGSSGGVLVTRSGGQVIGITTAGVEANQADNIGFAIPIHLARKVADPWVGR